MNLEKSKNIEYQKCAALLAKLTGADSDTEERVYKCFQSMGIKSFFLHLDSLDLPQEIIEKLKNIKCIVDMVDEKGGLV